MGRTAAQDTDWPPGGTDLQALKTQLSLELQPPEGWWALWHEPS